MTRTETKSQTQLTEPPRCSTVGQFLSGEGHLERACLWLCLKRVTSGVEPGWTSQEREVITIAANFLGIYLNSDFLLLAQPFPWALSSHENSEASCSCAPGNSHVSE